MQPPTRRAPRLSWSRRVWKVVGSNTPSSVPGSGLAGPAVPGTRPQDTRPPQVSDEGRRQQSRGRGPQSRRWLSGTQCHWQVEGSALSTLTPHPVCAGSPLSSLE